VHQAPGLRIPLTLPDHPVHLPDALRAPTGLQGVPASNGSMPGYVPHFHQTVRSGPAARRRPHEQLGRRPAGGRARAQAAEEAVGLAFARKKLVAQEKKQKREQKDEAEKHLQMQRELARGPARAARARRARMRPAAHRFAYALRGGGSTRKQA